MATLHFVKKARKDQKDSEIKKGDSYYWWVNRITIGKTYHSIKHVSKTHPPRSALIQSEFLKTLWDIEDRLYTINTDMEFDVIQSEVESIRDDLQTLEDETQDKLDNMPSQLQDGSVGQLLQDRVSAVEDMVSELNSLDFDYDESEENKDAEKAGQKKAEVVCNIVEEIQNISYSGE